MVFNDITLNGYYFLRSAAALVVDPRKLGSVSETRYGEPFGDPVCVFGLERVLPAGKFIDFRHKVHPVNVLNRPFF